MDWLALQQQLINMNSSKLNVPFKVPSNDMINYLSFFNKSLEGSPFKGMKYSQMTNLWKQTAPQTYKNTDAEMAGPADKPKLTAKEWLTKNDEKLGFAGVGIDAAQSLLKPLDHQNLAQKGIDTAGSLAMMGGPIMKGIGIGLKTLKFVDTATGKKSKDQFIPVNQSIRGYDMQFNANANTKYGGLFGNKARKRTNRLTNLYDKDNALKLAASESTQRDMISATNMSPILMGKNLQQLKGGLHKDTLRYLSARRGARLEKKEILDKSDKSKKGEKVNVIPSGMLHARKNHMGMKEITHKGIPVVSYDKDGKIIQHAEIEKDEIIFHKELSEKVEKLHKKYKEKEDRDILLEVGKLLTYEILENTEDNNNLIKTT